MMRSRSRALGLATVAALTLAGPAGLAGATPGASPPGTITTIAGGVGGPGPATSLALDQTGGCFGMQVAGGRLYLGGYGAVRAINVRTGLLQTVAGQLVRTGFAGPDAWLAIIEKGPCSGTVDSFGNVVVPESGVQVVAAKSGTFYGQKMTAGQVYRLMQAGNCDGGACAVDVAVDHWGNVIASFSAGDRASINVTPARSGTYYGLRMKVGHVYRMADRGGAQVTPDRAGNLLVADDAADRVGVIAGTTGRFYGRAMTAGKLYELAGTGTAGFSGDGGPADKAKLNAPGAVTEDAAGNVVIGDTGNRRIRVVAERSGRFYRLAMKAGDIYTVIGNASPAARAIPVAATAVAVDRTGNLLAFDGLLVRALAVKTGEFFGQQMHAGRIYTVAGNTSGHPGDGGPAISAQFQRMFGLTVDSAGNIIQSSDARVRVVAAKSGSFYGQEMTAGNVYTVAGDGSRDFSGDGGPATKAGMLPMAVAADSDGNLLIADTNRLRVVPTESGPFYGQQMTAGDIYTIVGDGSVQSSGDGGPAVDAGVPSPRGLAFDAAGNLLIANGRIRVVAATTGTFYGQSMTAGDIYTVAGGGQEVGDGIPALQADVPAFGVTVDQNGNLVLAIEEDGEVRVVAASTGTFYGKAMTAGDVYTVVSGLGLSGEDETAGPTSVTVDGAGNLLISDPFNEVLWLFPASSGTFYGQTVTADHLYVAAGGGTAGLGDSGPGTKAVVSPYATAINSNGDLVITDQGNGRIRLLTH